MRRSRTLSLASMSLGIGCFIGAIPTRALQPLPVFVDGSRTHSPDVREADANLDAQRAQSELAIARLTPGISLRPSYTRNQYNVVFPGALFNEPGQTLALSPYNQLSLAFAVNVPLIDVASYWRLHAADLGIDSAAQQKLATRLQVESQVVQFYYQLVADLALMSAARRALDLAQASDKVTRDRVALGRSPRLEQDRADAQVEQQVQQIADVQLLIDTATQSLESLTGVKADLASGPQDPEDDLHEESAAESFIEGRPAPPALAAAQAGRAAAERQLQAAWLALLPTLSGAFNVQDGNYVGFSGREFSWAAALNLQWSLDFSASAALHATRAQLAVSVAREDRAQLAIRDGVHNAWSAVRAAIAKSRSARVQEKVTREAQELAQERYEAGSSTQLDLLQAQRDAFAGEVTRIQADADLANARSQLRLAAGIDPLVHSGAAP